MEKVFLSLAEFSKLYGCKKTKIYQLIKSGEVRLAKVGRRSFITAESAISFAERCLVIGEGNGAPLCNTHIDCDHGNASGSSKAREAGLEALRSQNTGKKTSGIFR